jgi:hypothetical protein
MAVLAANLHQYTALRSDLMINYKQFASIHLIQGGKRGGTDAAAKGKIPNPSEVMNRGKA